MIDVTVNENKKIKVENREQSIYLDGALSEYQIIKLSPSAFKVLGAQSVYQIDVVKNEGKRIALSINNSEARIKISDHIDQILEKLGMDVVQSSVVKEVKAPMPGSILDILVEEGDEVKANDQLLVLEAMKMENVIKSPGDGVVGKIHVSEKQNVEKNQVLISFE